VCEAIPQFQRMLGWMENFPKPCMVAREKLRPIGPSDLEHGEAPCFQPYRRNKEKHCTVEGSSNQVHLLLALRLFRR